MLAQAIITAVFGSAFGLAACFAGFASGEALAQAAPDYAALFAAPDRSDADRQADKRRDPLPFLAFAGVRPGMLVLDMAAGGGYSTELMARAVAPKGIVYRTEPAGSRRQGEGRICGALETPAMKDVVADIRPSTIPCSPA